MQTPTLTEFVHNLKKKQVSPLFLENKEGLLSPDVKYEQYKVFEWFKKKIVPSIA